MRLSIGTGVGPIRVSQTIARSGGRRKSGNALGDLIIATIGMVAWVVVMTVRLTIVIGDVVVLGIIRAVVAGRRNRSESEASH